MSKKRGVPICPQCGLRSVKTETQYGPRYDHCGLYAWGRHPLVSPETHEARKAAHAAFDRLWKSGRMSRADAYGALSQALGIEPKDCHMKLMDAATAARVPALTATIGAGR